MEVYLFGFVLAIFCNAAAAFLVEPSHQTTPNNPSHQNLIDGICRAYPTLTIPHPEECQLYYNCSLAYGNIPNNFEQHLMECNYPDLFSERTRKCENFTEVQCGGRREIKDACSYRKGKAEKNCNSPSCIGEPDGMVHTGNTMYKVCFKERLVKTGSCQLWFELPYHGKCTSRLEIPMSEGGLLPSCSGKVDGIYAFTHPSGLERMLNYGDYFGIGRRCDAYYRCIGGIITVVKCQNGTVFHADVGACRPGNASLSYSCQLYCNPEKTLLNIPLFPVNVEECPYPLQFSEKTKRCENFTEVVCGSRKEETYICQYLKPLYFNRHGGHCGYTNPSQCNNEPDGVFPHPYRHSDIAFIRCYRKRLVEQGNCSIDQAWSTQTYPYNGTCTQSFAIPTSAASYGRLPDCTAKSDGNYQFRTRPCDAYYRCEGGKATAVKCPEHTDFDVTRRECSSNVACYRA